jgi:hypothetical protein
VLPMEGERKPTPIANTPADERMAEFSPNGRWVAYQSDESGRFEIYVKPFPVRPEKWPVSKDGGFGARWSDDGKEIYYISPDAQLMTVPIAVIGGTIEAGTPMALFQTRIWGGGTSRLHRQQYDVASDGPFLINDTIEYMATSPITVLFNWKPPRK